MTILLTFTLEGASEPAAFVVSVSSLICDESTVFETVADTDNGINNKATLSAVQQALVIGDPYHSYYLGTVEIKKCCNISVNS